MTHCFGATMGRHTLDAAQHGDDKIFLNFAKRRKIAPV
jgi:hypothetical protein